MSTVNPFAQALGNTSVGKSSSAFTEALSQAGGQGQWGSNFTDKQSFDSKQYGTNNTFHQPDSDFSFEDPFLKQQKQAEQQEYERKRLVLHNKINPVDQRDIFDQREKATQKRIDELRKDLRKLSKEIRGLYKDIEITLMGNVTNTGMTGIGQESFFEKLRNFIMLLTKKVRSARTWAQTAKAKSKKKGRGNKGLGEKMNTSSGHEQRAAMDEFFNSERGDNMGE